LTGAASEGESDSQWTTPEYSGAAPNAVASTTETVEAELTAFVQTGSDEEDGWTTPTYSDAVAPTGSKEYARVIVPAESEQSLIEAAAEQTVGTGSTAETEVKLVAPRIIRSARARPSRRVIFHTPRRYRAADAPFPRPRWNRYAAHTHRRAARLLAGMALRSAEHAAYDKMESYCSTRLPESYGKYCRPVLRQFRRLTEGLSYGDGVDRVCVTVGLCKHNSYITHSPHNRLGSRN